MPAAGTMWKPNFWGANVWAANFWADAEIPVVLTPPYRPILSHTSATPAVGVTSKRPSMTLIDV